MREKLTEKRNAYVIEIAGLHAQRDVINKRLQFLRGAVAATNDLLKEAEAVDTESPPDVSN